MHFLGPILLLAAFPSSISAASLIQQYPALQVDLGYAVYTGAFDASTRLNTWKGSVTAFLTSIRFSLRYFMNLSLSIVT
jgi:hypothetical protein